MKKSTLITTIAMIVVVVVALSTATYAWFSSSTDTKVQTTITTQAAEGWILYGGTYNTGSSSVTYSSTTPLALTMQDGLWSPVGTTGPNTSLLESSALNSANATAQFTSANFFEAKVVGVEYKVNTPSAPVTANFIRVINSNPVAAAETFDPLLLTIYVIVGPEGTDDGSFRAAAGFSTYISTYINGGSEASFNTAYSYGKQSTSTTGNGDGYYTADYIAVQDKSAGVTLSQNGATPISPDNAIAKTGFDTLSAAQASAFGASEGDYYRSIEVAIGNVGKTKAVNIAFYAWLDGWVLDDTAGGAELKVVYSFSTAS